MARYRRFDPRFWKDEKVRTLTLTEKSIAIYGFTAQSNRIGIFSFSPGEACEDLELKPETFAKGFKNVCQTLGWQWEERSRVLYLPTWWKYNPPENANNVIGSLKDLSDVPHSPLISLFSNNLQYLPGTLHQTFTQTFSERYPKRSPSQEQYQEQYQEQELYQEKEPPISPKGDDGFANFWQTYQYKKSKGKAEKAWKKINPSDELQATILAAIPALHSSKNWTKENGAWRQHPATWLDAKGWEDEEPTSPTTTPIHPHDVWPEPLDVADGDLCIHGWFTTPELRAKHGEQERTCGACDWEALSEEEKEARRYGEGKA